MLETTGRPTCEQAKNSPPAAFAQQLAALKDQPDSVQVRELVALCQQMSRQYRVAPETCLERSWWRLFNQAGIWLREALDQAKAEDYQGLSDWEADQAYFLLIHVAYFFVPGGIAETIWLMLPSEPDMKREEIFTNDALGVAFGRQPQVYQLSRLRQQISRWKRQLGQLLGRSASGDSGAWVLRELVAYEPPSLDEESVEIDFLATRRPSDGAHPGR